MPIFSHDEWGWQTVASVFRLQSNKKAEASCGKRLRITKQLTKALGRISANRTSMCGVEVWRGGLGRAYRWPTLSSVGASLAPPCFRFHTPLIEPVRADLPHPALGGDSRNRRSHCMWRRLQLLKTTWELSGSSPISLSIVASCVRLQLKPLPSTGVTRRLRRCLFEACSAFTHVTACLLAESPMRPSTPQASAASLPPPLLRLLPGGANQFPGGLLPLWTTNFHQPGTSVH